MKILLRSITALVCACTLLACSDSPSLNYVPQDGTIVAFGDSLTVGVGAAPEESYPQVLAQLSQRTVIGAGVSGEETTAGQKRLAQVLEETTPNLLILLQGGNDILRNRNMQTVKRNLATMIELARARGIDVVLIGVPAKKLFSDVAPLYTELADEYRLVFAEELLSGLLRDSQYKSDPVHLNKRGYRKLAEEIHTLLQEHGAL